MSNTNTIKEIGEFYNRKKEEVKKLRETMRRVIHSNYDTGSPLGTVLLKGDKIVIREDDFKTIRDGIDQYIQMIEKRMEQEP